MSDTVGVQLAPGRFVRAGRRAAADPRRPGVAGRRARRRRAAAGGHRPARRPAAARAVPGRPCSDALTEARRRLDRVSAALDGDPDAGRRRQAAQAAGPGHDGPGHRAPRPGPRRARRLRRLRVRFARAPAPRDRPARRRPRAARGRVEQPDGGPDERHDPDVAGGPGRPARRPHGRRRRRQPVRLRRPGAALLRHPPARPARRRLPGRRARRADGPHHRRRRSHAGPVHELEGDGPGRGGGARARRRAGADPARPAQAGTGARASPPTRRRACSPRPGSSRASTCPAAR